MFKFLLALILFSISTTSPALETDQFMAWNTNLEDSTGALNQKFNDIVNIALRRINKEKQIYQCHQVINKIAKAFRTWTDRRINNWIYQNLDVYPPQDLGWLEQYKLSIYYDGNGSLSWPLPIPLEPTIKVNNILIGIDKISHFILLGKRYFITYQKALQEGANEIKANQLAVEAGIEREKGALGLRSTGVMSFADLEANYQGFKWFKQLCDNQKPVLVKDDIGNWSIKRQIDLTEFISPLWDESFNPSVYSRARWETVRLNLYDYCPQFELQAKQQQFADYTKKSPVNFSTEYLKSLQSLGKIPSNQKYSIRKVCEEF